MIKEVEQDAKYAEPFEMREFSLGRWQLALPESSGDRLRIPAPLVATAVWLEGRVHVHLALLALPAELSLDELDLLPRRGPPEEELEERLGLPALAVG